MQIKRAVFIGDNKFLETLLKQEFDNIEFVFCNDSDTAIKSAVEHNSDIFIISRVLKNETGFDASHKIREHAETQNLPIIMISSTDDEQVINQAYRAGVNSFVEKNEIVDNLRKVFDIFIEFGSEIFHTNILLISSNKNSFYAYKSRLNLLGISIDYNTGIPANFDRKYDFMIIDSDADNITYLDISVHLIYPSATNALVLIDKTSEAEKKKRFVDAGFTEFYIKPFVLDNFIKDLLARLMNKENKFRDKTALIVDDSRIFRIQMTSIIEGMGIKAQTAADVEEALGILAQQKIDLIITDIFMPNISGEAFIKLLKSKPEYRNIPIIVLSSAERKTKIISCFELGADDFIGKPINVEEVIARVKRIMKCRNRA